MQRIDRRLNSSLLAYAQVIWCVICGHGKHHQ